MNDLTMIRFLVTNRRYFKYANLNPRIAAFLGKQDPKSPIKRAKGSNDDKDAANQDAKPGPAESAASNALGFLGGFGDGLSQEARSLLPEISQGGMALVKMGMLDESIGPSRMSFNETDDPQRYQFEETTFAAPNILRELSDNLERFDRAYTEFLKRSKTQHEDKSIVERKQPADLLPAQLKNMLSQEWPELIAEAVYTPRAWQSQAYKSGYKYASTLASGGRQLTAMTGLERESGAKNDLKVYIQRGVVINEYNYTLAGAAISKRSAGHLSNFVEAAAARMQYRYKIQHCAL